MSSTTRDRIVGVATSVVLLGAVGFGAVALGQARTAAQADPAAVVETEAPAIVIPTDAPNGLAAEEEAAAAAAKAEADRIAAEQAAAAEAARIAAEQAAQAEAQTDEPAVESFDEPVEPDPEPAPAPPAPPPAFDPNANPRTICEVLPDGTPVPCQ